MVMNAMADGTSGVSTPSHTTERARARRPSSTALYWVEHTDSTDTEMRLNSSKQPQAPVWASPL